MIGLEGRLAASVVYRGVEGRVRGWSQPEGLRRSTHKEPRGSVSRRDAQGRHRM